MTSSDDRFSDLMFLLAMAPLAAGCPGDDSSTSNTTTPNPTTTNDGTTMDPTSAGTVDPPGTSTGGQEGTSGGTTMGADSTTGEATAGDSTTGGFDCTPKMKLPEKIDPNCTTYAELINECYVDGQLPQECVDLEAGYCQYYLDSYGMMSKECGTAALDALACLAQLSCKELMMKESCADEIMAQEMACGAASPRQPRWRR